MKCFSRKLYKKYKSHNLTKKPFYDFKTNITKYLSPSQIMSLKCKHNDILKYKHKKNPNYNAYAKQLTQKYSYKPLQLKSILSNMMKRYKPFKEMIFSEPTEEFYCITTNYPIYYYKKNNVEYKILDLNVLSKGFSYFRLGTIEMNPSREYIVFNIDFIGDRMFHLFIKPIFSDEIVELKTYHSKKKLSVHETLNGSASDFFIWIDDDHIAYTINNSSYNTNKTYVYNIHSHKNKLVYQNKNTFIEVKSTANYNIIYDSDYNSDELYLLDDDVTLLLKRQKDVSYPFIEHYDGIWYIHETNQHRDVIKTTQDFKHFNILYENNNPTQQIKQVTLHMNEVYFILSNCVYSLNKKILEVDPIYYLKFGNIRCNELEIIRHSYLSPPFSQYYTTKMTPYKPPQQPYMEKNIYIKPLLYFTLMYKKGNPLKHRKCVLYGYGAYSDNLDRGYLPFIFELLDKGFIVAYAHIRGGGEFGFKGYDEGRLTHKKNTFYDFITIAKYLCKHYTSKELLTIWGRSAGGLLISSVLNMEPELCNLAILGVPFVTPILTMKNNKNPLGFESHSEFGNPFIREELAYLQSYDPIPNIKNANYPNIFIYTNLNDTLVPYKEPLMYYEALQKIDVFKDHKKDLTLFIDPLYGHAQGFSTYQTNESFARVIDVIFKYYKIETN